MIDMVGIVGIRVSSGGEDGGREDGGGEVKL